MPYQTGMVPLLLMKMQQEVNYVEAELLLESIETLSGRKSSEKKMSDIPQ